MVQQLSRVNSTAPGTASPGSPGRVEELQVGFFSTAKYPNGQAVTNVAVWNEFGTGRIPERPFFRQALAQSKRSIGPMIKASLDGRKMAMDRQAAGRVGAFMKDRIQTSITTLRSPPNAPATVEIKGSSNPLVDTGFLRNSVDWVID